AQLNPNSFPTRRSSDLGKHQYATSSERTAGGAGAHHRGCGTRSEESTEFHAAVAGKSEGIAFRGVRRRVATGRSSVGQRNRPAGRGGETLPRFHTADGYPAGTNAACGTFEGSAGVRAAAAAEIQHPTSSIAADRCARGLRGSRFAQAGGAESGAERRGSHAQRRTIAAGPQPAR